MKAAFMPIEPRYKATFEKRFFLRISFWAGFFGFFSQEDPYERAIKDIKNKNVEDALKADRDQLRIDFYNACRKHKKELSQHKVTKELVDACQ